MTMLAFVGRTVALPFLALMMLAGAAFAGDTNLTFHGIAIQGYDPVAYFTDGKPVPGDPAITASHDGAIYQFASEAHKAAFEADPGKYAPQYGGYCAWAVSNGYTAGTDPRAFSISGGKLYLNYSRSVQARWAKDISGNVSKADANWPGVLE